MECVADIQHYNTMMQEDRVYTFLDGLDDRLDNIRGDILQMKPFPTVEQAYAHVRREAVRQAVMISGDSIDNPEAVLTSKGFRPGQSSSAKSLSLDNGKHGSGSRPRASSDGLKCTHCGNLKHTWDTCFKLHGYPDWWNELQAKKRRDAPESTGGKGQAAVATADAPISGLSLSLLRPPKRLHHPRIQVTLALPHAAPLKVRTGTHGWLTQGHLTI
jgi:hypothetical protein